jgi:hypothetical protein
MHSCAPAGAASVIATSAAATALKRNKAWFLIIVFCPFSLPKAVR